MSFFQDQQFNASAVDTTDNFAPIPEGVYRVLVASTEERPTKAAGGLGLNVQYEVVEGKNKGRKLFHWINLRNNNKTAEEIGHKELARLCMATNVPQPRSPAEFCGKLISVKVKIEEYQGEKKNSIAQIILPDQAQPPAASQERDDAPAWGG